MVRQRLRLHGRTSSELSQSIAVGGRVGIGDDGTDCKSSGTPFEAYCDLTTDSGGWTRLWWLGSDNIMADDDVLKHFLPDGDAAAGTCFALMPVPDPTELHVHNDDNLWAS